MVVISAPMPLNAKEVVINSFMINCKRHRHDINMSMPFTFIISTDKFEQRTQSLAI